VPLLPQLAAAAVVLMPLFDCMLGQILKSGSKITLFDTVENLIPPKSTIYIKESLEVVDLLFTTPLQKVVFLAPRFGSLPWFFGLEHPFVCFFWY
jgi:hypothetical protein